MAKNFEIENEGKQVGSRANGKEVWLKKVSWYGKKPQWDLRNWQGEIAGNGITLSDEMLKTLRDLLNDIVL